MKPAQGLPVAAAFALLTASAHAQATPAPWLESLVVPTTSIGQCVAIPISDSLRKQLPMASSMHVLVIGTDGVESRTLSLMRDSARRIFSYGEIIHSTDSSGQHVFRLISINIDPAGAMVGIRHQLPAPASAPSAGDPQSTAQRALMAGWHPDATEQRAVRTMIAWLEPRCG